MAIEKVEAWKTSDGLMFGHKADAENHDAYLRLKQFVEDSNLGQDYDSSMEEATTFLWRHRDVLLDILSRAIPPTATEKSSR